MRGLMDSQKIIDALNEERAKLSRAIEALGGGATGVRGGRGKRRGRPAAATAGADASSNDRRSLPNAFHLPKSGIPGKEISKAEWCSFLKSGMSWNAFRPFRSVPTLVW